MDNTKSLQQMFSRAPQSEELYQIFKRRDLERTERLRDFLELSAAGGRGGGLFEGGGRVTGRIPLNDQLSLHPYIGGGGAYGSVPGENGRQQKIRSFSPEYGVGLNYRF